MKDAPAPTPPTPPVAKQSPTSLQNHGITRTDDYYWMRDDDRKDPEILAYLAQENLYTKAMLADTEALQEGLFEELKGRLEKDDASVPYLSRGYWYYTRFEKGKEYPIYCRKQGSLEANEEVMLDANVQAKSHEYYNVGDLDLSESKQLIAYSEDTLSRRIYTIKVKDLQSGKDLDDVVEGAAPDVVWAANDTHFFYIKKDPETLREFQVWRHKLGTKADQDTLVYQDDDETFHLGLWRSRDRKYIFVQSSSTLSDEVRMLPAKTPEAELSVFLPRQKDHEYTVAHLHDTFYVRSNWKAKNFRLMAVKEAKTADLSAWKEVIPHREDVFLNDFELFNDYLVLQERVGGMTTLRIKPWKATAAEHTIDFPDAAYYVYTQTNPDPDTQTLRFGYTSMTTPNSVFDYNMRDKSRTLLKQDKVLGGFDASNYVAKRVEAVARDGTKIPISLVYRKDLDRSKPAPLYQYGYGSYGLSMEPYFSPARLSLLDRGFIFAMAHIRGGQEFGRRWYEDGKLMKKMNTFTDFIDCSEYLIKEGYTSREKLVISGGSAGGLLVGAVANMAPQLYKAVVASVPFVDVVTTMLDETIPLTTFEYDEWGNPNEKASFEYMSTYSPYDNVVAQAYPNMLVMTGLHDSQVQYWEPAKWVAKLRRKKTDQNLLLFEVNMTAGHGGASGRFARYKEIALEYAFLLKVLGMPLE